MIAPRPGAVLVFLDRHKKSAWILALLPALIWGTYWIFDREPPFRVTFPPTIVNARAGQELDVRMKVERELDRRCSARVTRLFLDSQGTERGKTFEELNFEGIKAREARTPGELRLSLPLPASMPSGPAQIFTDSLYTCTSNPTTYLVPIRVTTVWEFTVLPPLVPETVLVITKPGAVEKVLKSIQPEIP